MGSTTSKEEAESKQPEQAPAAEQQVEQDDEPDEW